MKKILVTGGAGFIGSHLCDVLLGRGDEVWCVDNYLTGSKTNIEPLLANNRFKLIEADVAEPVANYLDFDEGIEEIYHLASPASPRGYQDEPVKTYKVNSFGTHYLCEFAYNTGAKILFASTSEVYGDPKEHPQKEEYWGNVNIRGVRSCYDVSKRFGEMVQTVWHRQNNLSIRTIRIFNTYGPRMDLRDGRVFPNLIGQALRNEPITVYGDGSQTRSYCYVTDLVDGIVAVMDNQKAEGAVYNLGNPDERTVLDTAKLIKELTKSSSEIIFKELPSDDPTRRQPDISRVKTDIGWEPKVDLIAGLEKTIEYFRGKLQ